MVLLSAARRRRSYAHPELPTGDELAQQLAGLAGQRGTSASEVMVAVAVRREGPPEGTVLLDGVFGRCG